MIPSTFTLVVAATSTVLSANALPIFSGFFGSPAPAALQQRDTNLTDGQLAQGTNAFFATLLLEDLCTPGQVGCINNNTATCSPEGNWEITPCSSSTTCLAIPASTTNITSQDLIVTCTDPTTALTLIEEAGGSDALAVDFSITTAPFNTTTVDSNDGSSNSTTTVEPTGSNNNTTIEPTGTNNSTDVPTSTDADSDPAATCTEDPSEPTETEYITVIAFPDPTDSSEFSFSTLEPTETLPADATPVNSTDVPTPTDTYADAGSNGAIVNATSTDYPCTMNATDSTAPADPTGTDTTNSTAPTTTAAADTGAPTTLVVPPNFSISTPVPDISQLGTFEIPASSSMPIPIRRRGMLKKVRRS